MLANNMIGRILDELVRPIRKLQLMEPERVALSALILLDGDSCGCSALTSEALNDVKDKVQNALFQFIRERCNNSLNFASSRFANILLLLPSIAKLSALYNENFQLAKMFGRQVLDPLLAEILLDGCPGEPVLQPVLSPTTKARMDACTQTNGKTDELNINTNYLTHSATNSTLSSVSSACAEDSALENIIALRLEMEQRAAQAKAEAQEQKRLLPDPPLPQPPMHNDYNMYYYGCHSAYNHGYDNIIDERSYPLPQAPPPFLDQPPQTPQKTTSDAAFKFL